MKYSRHTQVSQLHLEFKIVELRIAENVMVVSEAGTEISKVLSRKEK
jgi:hypothetical protein